MSSIFFALRIRFPNDKFSEWKGIPKVFDNRGVSIVHLIYNILLYFPLTLVHFFSYFTLLKFCQIYNFEKIKLFNLFQGFFMKIWKNIFIFIWFLHFNIWPNPSWIGKILNSPTPPTIPLYRPSQRASFWRVRYGTIL